MTEKELKKINKQLAEDNARLEKENRQLFRLLVENNVELPDELQYLYWKTLIDGDPDIPF